MNIKVLIPIADGTEEMEAVIMIDLLRRANIEVVVAGTKEIITGARKTRIVADTLLSEIDINENYQAVILPGGLQGTLELSDNQHLKKLLAKMNESEKVIGAICAAPTILKNNNIISEDNTITSHPSFASEFENYNYVSDRVVRDNNIYTSRGAGTAADFSFYLIEKLVNIKTANKIKEDIVY